MQFVIVQRKPKKHHKPYVIINSLGTGTEIIHAKDRKHAIKKFCGDAWQAFEQGGWKCVKMRRRSLEPCF